MKRLSFFLFAFAIAFLSNSYAQILPGTRPGDKGQLKSTTTSIVGSYPQQVDWYSWTGADWQADKVERITYNQVGDYLTVTVDFIEGTDLKTTYTYNSSRMPTMILEQEYVGGSWVNVERSRIEFDAYNNATLYVSEDYVGGSWVMTGGMQVDNEVQGGKLMKSTTSIWMEESKTYVLMSRTTYTYGANGQISSYISEDYTEEVWTKSTRVTLTYSDNGDEETMVYELWDEDQWVPYSKSTYEYRQNESQTVTMWAWDEDAADFVKMMRDVSDYDSHGNLILQTNEFWMGADWFMMSGYQFDISYQGDNVTQQITKEWQGTSFVNSTKEIFSGFLNLGVEDPGSLGLILHIYPNPSTGSLTIQYPVYGATPPSFQLVDVSGRPIMNETPKWGTRQLSWDISKIPAGVYFVRMIQGNGKVLIEKIMKQ